MKKSKEMCRGCYNDFYNHHRDDGCWSFKSAKVVKRIKVGTFEDPPYAKERAQTCLSCFVAQGCSMLPLDDCRVKPRAQIQGSQP